MARLPRDLHLIGNIYSNIAANQKWHEYALSLGYSCEYDMLKDLYGKYQSLRKIAKIMGYTRQHIRWRMLKLGLVLNGPGGPNHTKQNHGKGRLKYGIKRRKTVTKVGFSTSTKSTTSTR